jgi:hypothetical protein
MQINADSDAKKRATNALENKSKLLAKTDLAYWRKRLRKQPNSPNWFVEISARGLRRKLSLETPNKENAASKARDIYQLARAIGWDAVLQKYRPRNFEAKSNLTVGQFIGLAESVAGVEKVTLRGYRVAFRRIVSECFDLDPGKAKFDPYSGGHREWVERVDAVHLAKLTPQKIQQWKRVFLLSAAPDPISQRSAKTSVNTYLRQARSLFSKKILKHRGAVTLPHPLPFGEIEFEPRQNRKYRATFDVQKLIETAKDELAQTDPEAFKPSCSRYWWDFVARKSTCWSGIHFCGKPASSGWRQRSTSMRRRRTASATWLLRTRCSSCSAATAHAQRAPSSLSQMANRRLAPITATIVAKNFSTG